MKGNGNEMVSMNGTKVVKTAMSETGTTQAVLMEKLGYSGLSSVSQIINAQRMSLDKFIKLLDAMGYEVVVQRVERDESGEVVSRESKWRVEPKDLD